MDTIIYNPNDVIDISLTYKTGVTAQSSNYVSFKKTGRVCNLIASLKIEKDASTGWYELAHFSSQYAPKADMLLTAERFGTLQGEIKITNYGYIFTDKTEAMDGGDMALLRFVATWII